MAHSWHRKKVALTEFESERYSEVKGAVAQVIVSVLVLIDGFHQRYRVADSRGNLVKHKSWTFVEYKNSLAVFRAVTRDLTSNH